MITALKQQHDLVQYIESVLGESQAKGAWDFWSCPFHEDDTPSFAVKRGQDTPRFVCFGCNEHGDIIDFVQKYHRVDFKEAVRMLEGDTQTTHHCKPRPKPAPQPKTELPLERVLAAARMGQNNAYLRSRGIEPSTIKSAFLGAENRRSAYKLINGTKVGYRRPEITLPWFSYDGKLLGVKTRLDPLEAWNILNSMSTQQMWVFKADLARRFNAMPENAARGVTRHPDSVTDLEVFEALYQQRYMSWRGSSYRDHWYRESFLKTIDVGELRQREFARILVVESELDALCLGDMFKDEGGYLAVANKPEFIGMDLNTEFSKINRVFYIADNDQAGLDKAREFKKRLPRTKVVVPPVGKDISEFWEKKGERSVRQFMNTQGIMPTSRKVIEKWQTVNPQI